MSMWAARLASRASSRGCGPRRSASVRHWRRARRSEELERGARIERGLREGEGRLSAPHQAAALGLSLLGTDEKAVLQRLLGGAHRGLATAPLQLLAKLPEGLQLRVLGTVRERVLQAPHSVPRAKLSICTATLESVATLYGSSVGPITDAAHAHLLLVCTSLVPAVATSRGGLSAAGSSGCCWRRCDRCRARSRRTSRAARRMREHRRRGATACVRLSRAPRRRQ